MLQVKGKKRQAAGCLDVNVPVSKTLPLKSADAACYYGAAAAFVEASDAFEASG